MLRSQWIVGGVVGLIGLATVVGCGKSKGTGGAGGGTTMKGIQPPARPTGAKAGDSSGPKVLAITKIYIGTTDRTGAESSTAWENYGYDLDGQITTTDFTHHCKPNSNASPKDVFPDGKNGIDNSFGKKLLPIIKNAAGSTDIQGSLNGAIAKGSFTIMVDLPDLGTGTDYDPLKAYLLGGKNGTPNNAQWDLVPELLNGTTPESAKVNFPNSYLAKNTWVSGDKGTVDLSLSVAGFALDLKIASAVITMDLSGDHGTATNGVIAGVLNTEDFITELKKVVGGFSKDLCSGSAVDSILNQIRQSSDIMADGTQDPTQTCNGISIGLGFDAGATKIGMVAAPTPPAPDPCAMTTSSSSTGSGSSSSASTGTGGG